MSNKTRALILINGIQTPDGTEIYSKHRHDYVEHTDKNGEVYGVDGGLDYIRRTGNMTNVKDTSVVVTPNDSFEIMRRSLMWGSYGEDGAGPLKYIALADMDTDHIGKVLSLYEYKMSDLYRGAFRLELAFRDDAA
jgi:hypothetical protein